MSLELKKWYKNLPDNHPARNHSHYNCIDEKGVYFPSDISWPGGGGPKYKVLHPVTKKPVRVPNRGWVYPTIERMNEVISLGLVHFGDDETSVPCKKTYLYENENSTPYSVFYKDGRAATKRLRLLMGETVFQNPKDEEILQSIFNFSNGKYARILDFFAGSGTTLHATLNLNKEDDGNRQCILVQQSEDDNNICENVTYERNRRVMCGYTNAKGENVDGLGGSLKYYKTGFVGKHQSKNANDADKVELAEKAGCLIALAENTLETIKVTKAAKGFWQIYSDNAEKKKRYTCIYHNGDYGKVSDFVAKIDELRATDKKSKFTVYVFSWNAPDFFENEFDDLKNIEIKAIPKPILEIYKALNR